MLDAITLIFEFLDPPTLIRLASYNQLLRYSIISHPIWRKWQQSLQIDKQNPKWLMTWPLIDMDGASECRAAMAVRVGCIAWRAGIICHHCLNSCSDKYELNNRISPCSTGSTRWLCGECFAYWGHRFVVQLETRTHPFYPTDLLGPHAPHRLYRITANTVAGLYLMIMARASRYDLLNSALLSRNVALPPGPGTGQSGHLLRNGTGRKGLARLCWNYILHNGRPLDDVVEECVAQCWLYQHTEYPLLPRDTSCTKRRRLAVQLWLKEHPNEANLLPPFLQLL